MNRRHLPPKPRLALAIGITGHRPNESNDSQAAEALQGQIRQITRDNIRAKILPLLTSIKTAVSAAELTYAASFSDAPPCLSLVTSLAEGTDRIVAWAALEQEYQLNAPLPFTIDEYEHDFKEEVARVEYRKLLALIQEQHAQTGEPAKAGGVLELPGNPDAAPKAYELAGRTMLDHISLLLAVWDGATASGRGGTETVIAEAVRRGLPVIVIDALDAQKEAVLYWGGLAEHPVYASHISDLPQAAAAEVLPVVIDNLIQPPVSIKEKEAHQQNSELEHLDDYYKERRRNLNLRLEWPFLMGLFGVRRPRAVDIKVASLKRSDTSIDEPATKASALSLAYDCSDTLGRYYATVFRSAFVANFMLASMAVFIVALSILLQKALHLDIDKVVFVTIEIILIGLLIYNTWQGGRRNWHRRWLETREVAEHLRIAAAMRGLATRPVIPPGPLSTWTTWYVRATLRDIGMPTASFAEYSLKERRDNLRNILDQQKTYHQETAKRLHTLEHRMEKTGEVLFVATLLTAILFVVLKLGTTFQISDELKFVVTAITAGFPVLATATYGIRVIGDFAGNALRSQRMASELDHLLSALDTDPSDDLNLAQERARQAATIMLGDVATWRTSAESRGLEIPG